MKFVPLRFNYEFSRVYMRGRFAVDKNLSLHAFRRPNGLKHNLTLVPSNINRVGFCANKKKLGAVGRNRVRRLMREAYRCFADDLPKGYDMAFTLRNCTEIPSYSTVHKEIGSLLRKAGLLNSSMESKDGSTILN